MFQICDSEIKPLAADPPKADKNVAGQVRGFRVITVFGSVNLDLIGTVERLPAPGETVQGRTFSTAPGGKGANQALAVARADAPVQMVGAVGRDAFAAEALALLDEGAVDLSRVARVDHPTGIALILVDRAGENVIAVVPGANGSLTEATAAAIGFAPGDLLLMQMEIPEPAIREAMRQARAAGVAVVLNAAPYLDAVPRLAAEATHVILNEHECEWLCQAVSVRPVAIRERVAELSHRLGNAVVVTLGPDGAIACADGEITTVPAIPVEPVDTVGAGDTFCGYFAAELHRGSALADALRIAAAAGSLACTRHGAQPSIPTRADVLEALRTG